MAVIYLIFTEGYAAPQSEDAAGLADEAVRLAELLTRLLALQAEIAAVHAVAPTAAATDWTKVIAGYDALLRLQPSPVVALNRAIAVGLHQRRTPRPPTTTP